MLRQACFMTRRGARRCDTRRMERSEQRKSERSEVSYTLKPNRGRRIDRDLHPGHHDVSVVTQRVKNDTILYRVRPYRRRLALAARPETTGKGSMELPGRFTEQLPPFGIAHHLVYDYYHI